MGVVQVSGEVKDSVSTTKSTKGTKVPLFVGLLRNPRATGMTFGTRTGHGSYLPRKNTRAGPDAAETRKIHSFLRGLRAFGVNLPFLIPLT